MNKKKFIIHSNGNWSPGIGGNIFMHKLCHDINMLGETAFITNKITHPNLNAPFYRHSNNLTQLKLKDYIVITSNNNRFNAKNIVRLFLHYKKTNDVICYKQNELIVSTWYNQLLPCVYTNFIDYNIFNKKNRFKRKGSAYMIRKGNILKQIHPNDSILIDPYTSNWHKMADIFNSVETFFCYDNYTLWVILAVLCGCKVIVAPELNRYTYKQLYTAEQWRESYPHYYYGVAYGVSNEELEYAENTRTKLRKALTKINIQSLNTVKDFIKLCNEKFSD